MDKTNQILDFNKRERVGLIVILVLSLALFALRTSPVLTASFQVSQQNFIKDIQFEHKGIAFQELDSVKLLPFDPNKVSEEDLRSFGLDNYAIKSWTGFLKKGYRFRKREDVKKIYGLKEEDYLHLFPYLKIEKIAKEKPKAQAYKTKKKYRKQKDNTIRIDINSANEEEFMKLKGIGKKRARTIIKFRNILGGFYSIDQIEEVYGIDSSLFASIKAQLVIDQTKFKRLNIFELPADSLQTHKFINFRAANAIKRYIKNNPGIEQVEADVIRNLDGVDSNYINKALPYMVLRKY